MLAAVYGKPYLFGMDTLTFSDTRANLKAVMDRVVADRAPVAIARRKAEGVVMVSASE